MPISVSYVYAPVCSRVRKCENRFHQACWADLAGRKKICGLADFARVQKCATLAL